MAQPRLRSRVSALLNVDRTIDKVDASLDRFNETLVEFNQTLERFTAALEQFGGVVQKVDAVGDDLEIISGRLTPLVSGPDLSALRLPEQVRRLGRLRGGRETQPADPQAPRPDADDTPA
jgi:hypothetical protein